MRFLSIYRAAERGTPPSADEMATMGKFVDEMFRSGKLLATEGCLPSALGARVRRGGGRITVTDGPFAEAKEVVAGFALLEAESKQEAIALTQRFLEVCGDGECEIRQLYDASSMDSCVAQAAEATA